MKTNRFAHAALGLLTLAAALGAAPALPEALDPARTVRSEVLGEAAPRLDVSAGGASHTRVDWAPGALLALEQEDGVTRFAVEGAGEPESEGLPLLPRASRWLEIPPTGDVRLVVHAPVQTTANAEPTPDDLRALATRLRDVVRVEVDAEAAGRVR